MNNQEQNIKDILETVNFIKDNAASKQDLKNLEKRVDDLPTKQDLKNLENRVDDLPTKDDLVQFTTKEDLFNTKEEIRQDFSNLQTSVDNYAKRADTYFQELAALKSKIDRLEGWINKIAQKVDVELSS